MPMVTSEIFKTVDLTKTQKSRYLKKETLFFPQMKNFISLLSSATLWQKKSFVAEVTFKGATKSYRKIIFLSATKKVKTQLTF